MTRPTRLRLHVEEQLFNTLRVVPSCRAANPVCTPHVLTDGQHWLWNKVRWNLHPGAYNSAPELWQVTTMDQLMARIAERLPKAVVTKNAKWSGGWLVEITMTLDNPS